MIRLRFKLRHISIAISLTVLVILSTMTMLHNRLPQLPKRGLTLIKSPEMQTGVGYVHQKSQSSHVFEDSKSSTPNLKVGGIDKGSNGFRNFTPETVTRETATRETVTNYIVTSKQPKTAHNDVVTSRKPKITENKTPKNKSTRRAIWETHNSTSKFVATTQMPFKKYMTNLSDISLYDEYLKTTMNSNCQNASTYDAIIAVHTAPGNNLKRQAFRWLYSDVNKTHPYKIKMFFFIGLVKNLTLQSELTDESKTFGDIVQGSFLDSYRNLTYKAIFSYKWLNEQCRGLRLLLRLDDDVYVRIGRFFDVWKSKVGARNKTILCDVKENDPVTRKGKWRIDRSEISEDNYTFQHCLGYFAALTPDLAPPMFEAARRTPFFWIDDVFMYGFSANKAGARFVNAYYDMARTRYERFRDCFHTDKNKCKLMAVITKPETFQFLYFLTEDRLKEWDGKESNMFLLV